MGKNFRGVMTAPKDTRFTAEQMADFAEPREYDRKLNIIRTTLTGDFDQWYQNIVNLPAAKWRAAIDEKITQLCDADQRAKNNQQEREKRQP